MKALNVISQITLALGLCTLGTTSHAAAPEGDSSTSVHVHESELEASTPIDLSAIPEPDVVEFEVEDAAVSPYYGYAIGWSRWFSEENPPVTCNTHAAVRGFRCSGRFCDNVRLLCRRKSGAASSARRWYGYFSEENTSYRICPANHWVTGLACKGRFCDNLAMECSRMTGSAKSCSWSGWFSEEDPAFNAGTNRFIRGIQCSGNFCDNKRFYTCEHES